MTYCGHIMGDILIPSCSLDWWRWHFEKTKLFTVEAGDDLDGDGVRVTRQWAKIMDKYDPTHNNEIMRWNRKIPKSAQSSAKRSSGTTTRTMSRTRIAVSLRFA